MRLAALAEARAAALAGGVLRREGHGERRSPEGVAGRRRRRHCSQHENLRRRGTIFCEVARAARESDVARFKPASAADHGPLSLSADLRDYSQSRTPTGFATARRGRRENCAAQQREPCCASSTATGARAAAAPRRLAGADLKCGERDRARRHLAARRPSPKAKRDGVGAPVGVAAVARRRRPRLVVPRRDVGAPRRRDAAAGSVRRVRRRVGLVPGRVRGATSTRTPRTFGLGGMNLRELAPHLRRVLMAYAVADPETAYCQGMGFVAGAALLPVRHRVAAAVGRRRGARLRVARLHGQRPARRLLLVGHGDGLAAHQQALRELLQRRRPALVAHLDDLGCPIECFTAPLLLKGFQQLPLPLALEAMDLLAARRVSALQLVLAAVCEHAAPAMTRAKDAIDVQNALAQACDMRMRLRTLVDAHVGGRERCMRRRSVRCRRCPRYLPVRQSPARADSGAAGPRCVSCEPEGADADGCGRAHECVTVSLLPPPPLVRAPPPPASGPPRSAAVALARAGGARRARADYGRGRRRRRRDAAGPSRPCLACLRRRRGGPLTPQARGGGGRDGRASRACDLLQLGLHAAAAHEEEVVITTTRTAAHENEAAAGSPPRPYSLPLNVSLTLATLRLAGRGARHAAALAACEFIRRPTRRRSSRRHASSSSRRASGARRARCSSGRRRTRSWPRSSTRSPAF